MVQMQVVKLDGGTARLDEAAIGQLRSRVRGPVLMSSDPEYDVARAIWNAMIDRKPALIVRCTGTADVMGAVDFAREHQLLLSVRSGGHNIDSLVKTPRPPWAMGG